MVSVHREKQNIWESRTPNASLHHGSLERHTSEGRRLWWGSKTMLVFEDYCYFTDSGWECYQLILFKWKFKEVTITMIF